MEDLWKLREMNYRLQDLGEQAEYDLMLRRFREQERRDNMRHLLYGQAPGKPGAKPAAGD